MHQRIGSLSELHFNSDYVHCRNLNHRIVGASHDIMSNLCTDGRRTLCSNGRARSTSELASEFQLWGIDSPREPCWRSTIQIIYILSLVHVRLWRARSDLGLIEKRSSEMLDCSVFVIRVMHTMMV